MNRRKINLNHRLPRKRRPLRNVPRQHNIAVFATFMADHGKRFACHPYEGPFHEHSTMFVIVIVIALFAMVSHVLPLLCVLCVAL